MPRSTGFESVILRGNVKRGEGLVIQSLNRERAARRAARDSLDFFGHTGVLGFASVLLRGDVRPGEWLVTQSLKQACCTRPINQPFLDITDISGSSGSNP